MGVNGIWEYIQRHALKISAHSLRNKKLAIDGHIWLFESLKGSAAHGVAATHIATFFNRCSRLRELGIEPIVVFDNYSKDFKSHNSEHVKKSKRGGASQKLSDLVSFKQKIDEICELLTAMGVRWLIAINQGEAQCAQLEQAGLVDGCITSDFDYLLFGGKNIYRLEFIQGGRSVREEVRHFSLDNLFETMKLNRERLVALAMLLGCDYFQGGIERIGVVRGLEIISEFAMVEDDHPVTILDRFYSYSMQEVPGRNTDSEVRRKLRRASFSFPTGFPNGEMFLDSVNAYLQPEVYIYKELPQKNPQSAENVEKLLIKFCNWNADKVQETFERIEKKSKLNKANASQTKLTTFYTPSRRRSSSRTAVVTECSPEDSASCSRREWAALKTLRSKALLCPKHDDEEPRPTTIKAKRPRPTTKGAPARKRRPPPRHIANSVVEIDDTSSSVQILD